MRNKIKLKKVKPNVSFPGSLIQQNHGESLDKHGYLLWDVESRTFEEFDIQNDYGFYTLDVNDGVVPNVTDMPLKPRLRVRVSNTEPSQIKRVLTEIKKKYKVEEFTVTRMDTLSKQKTGNFDNNLSIGNIKDVELQNKLIKDYLNRQFLINDTTIDKIQQINRDINTKLVDDDSVANINWIPKTFEFSNMFSYGDNNIVKFDNAKGMVGVFAPNASGKSSLFDAISFCIFDKTSRTNLAKSILNNRKSNFYCKLHFQIDGVDYFIERIAKLINKGKSVKVDVNFWVESDDTITSLNGEQRRDSNSIIQQYLGTYEDFVLTTLSLQGNNALFIDKSQTERKEILAQFLGVDVFDKLYTYAQEENRDNSSLIRKFKQDDFTQKLADIEVDLNSTSSEYKLEEIQLNKAKDLVDDYNQKLISLNEKIVKVKSDNYSLADLEIDRDKLIKVLDDVKSQKNDVQSKLTELEATHIEIEDDIDLFDEADINKKFSTYKKSIDELKEIQVELDKITIKEDSIRELINHNKSHKYNPDCDICIENSKEVIESQTNLENKLEKLIATKTKLNTSKIKVEDYINNNSDIEATHLELVHLKKREDTISRNIDNSLAKLTNLENKEIKSTSELDKTIQLIDDYLDNEIQIKKNRAVRDEIIEVRNNLSEVKTSVKNSEEIVLKLNGKLSSLENQKEHIEARINEVAELEEQSKLYEYYLSALGKDGISYELISKALPMIEGEVNNILGQIVEFGLQLEMDGKNINANIVYDDQKWSLELCSGMEKFISGLAIRIALINVCNLPRPNFLVIDEGFGTLDSENLTSLYMLFDYLKTQFDFTMIISHIDSMRDVVDSLIEIKQVNGFSHIKF